MRPSTKSLQGSSPYAIGHGCAADWAQPVGGFVSGIWSDVMPVYETPPTTAELEFTDESGNLQKLRVSMRKLAGLTQRTLDGEIYLCS